MSQQDTAAESHLPYFAEGPVVSGFGRGSKELGIPTANFPEDVVRALPESFACGVYFGWAKIGSSDAIYKMSLCVGWNPYYHNTVKTMETHVIHEFPNDFYGEHLKVVVVGYIRPMCDFDSLDSLITAIRNDNRLACQHLDSSHNLKFRQHPFFSSPPQNLQGEELQANQRSLHCNGVSKKENGAVLSNGHGRLAPSDTSCVPHPGSTERATESRVACDTNGAAACNGVGQLCADSDRTRCGSTEESGSGCAGWNGRTPSGQKDEGRGDVSVQLSNAEDLSAKCERDGSSSICKL